jgi:hypothetical protein
MKYIDMTENKLFAAGPEVSAMRRRSVFGASDAQVFRCTCEAREAIGGRFFIH